MISLEHRSIRYKMQTPEKANILRSYGFIMYHNYDDAENCIRAFYFLGYEAKFAKVDKLV